MIRPDNCLEAPRGTSFYHDGYANFTIQLIIQFYRSANPVHVRDESRRASGLIIAAYRSQMHDYEFLLDQVASAEVPKSLIDVRTIDGSLSHEADYVFIDLTRTDKHSFLKNSQRINVSASRAQSAHFSSVLAAKFPSSTPSVISWSFSGSATP
ncbi:MFS monocarboxylate transporter [Fusarium acutatum]|uniref:MFS monocarboxylate transporter n=1 Tax=Fusarium acutatum TaxID=78861 RepID=A0A8H4K4M8_9HYPO|nr:MFS monocarboxylate transporter [Fusarium acutatum]